MHLLSLSDKFAPQHFCLPELQFFVFSFNIVHGSNYGLVVAALIIFIFLRKCHLNLDSFILGWGGVARL